MDLVVDPLCVPLARSARESVLQSLQLTRRPLVANRIQAPPVVVQNATAGSASSSASSHYPYRDGARRNPAASATANAATRRRSKNGKNANHDAPSAPLGAPDFQPQTALDELDHRLASEQSAHRQFTREQIRKLTESAEYRLKCGVLKTVQAVPGEWGWGEHYTRGGGSIRAALRAARGGSSGGRTRVGDGVALPERELRRSVKGDDVKAGSGKSKNAKSSANAARGRSQRTSKNEKTGMEEEDDDLARVNEEIEKIYAMAHTRDGSG